MAWTERVCQSQYAYRAPSGATHERGTGTHLATARSKLKPYEVSVFTALLGSAVNAASGKVRKPPLPNWPLDIGSLHESVLASGTALALGLEAGTGDGSGAGVVLAARLAAELALRPRPKRGASAAPAPPATTRSATTIATTLVQAGQLLI